MNIDLPKGLTERMDFGVREERWRTFDYEGILFHCRRCHKYGHLVKECELHLKKAFLASGVVNTNLPNSNPLSSCEYSRHKEVPKHNLQEGE